MRNGYVTAEPNARPRLIDFRSVARTRDLVDSVLDHLRAGGLLAYPTETVYGFGGLPTAPVIGRLAALKNRADSKPMLLLVADRESVSDLEWTPEAMELADVFWPGSLTLVLADPQARYPDGVRAPRGTVAVRVSPHPVVADLVGRLGQGLLSTSANVGGGAPALDARGAFEAAVAAGAGDELWVLDGGGLEPSPPSTIIDCSGPAPLVLREGTVPLERVRCVFPDIRTMEAMP